MSLEYDTLVSYLDWDERLVSEETYALHPDMYDKIIARVVIVRHIEWPDHLDFVSGETYAHVPERFVYLGTMLRVRVVPEKRSLFGPGGVYIDRLEYQSNYETNREKYQIIGVYARLEYDTHPGTDRYIVLEDYYDCVEGNPDIKFLGVSYLCVPKPPWL